MFLIFLLLKQLFKLTANIPPVENSPADIMDSLSMFIWALSSRQNIVFQFKFILFFLFIFVVISLQSDNFCVSLPQFASPCRHNRVNRDFLLISKSKYINCGNTQRSLMLAVSAEVLVKCLYQIVIRKWVLCSPKAGICFTRKKKSFCCASLISCQSDRTRWRN